MKKFIKENWFKISISFAAVLLALSMAYYFFYIPFKKNHDFNRCLTDSANSLLQQQVQINSQITDLEKQRDNAQSVADNELQDFLNNNPEPAADNFSGLSGFDRLNAVYMGEHFKWQEKKNSIFNLVNSLKQQIGNLEKRRDNEIVKEKNNDDNECYKKYK